MVSSWTVVLVFVAVPQATKAIVCGVAEGGKKGTGKIGTTETIPVGGNEQAPGIPYCQCCKRCKDENTCTRFGLEANVDETTCSLYTGQTTGTNSETLYPIAASGADCNCGDCSIVKGDPHFVTLDNKAISIRHQPTYEDSGRALKARYLLFRTANCRKNVSKQNSVASNSIPAIDLMYEPEVAWNGTAGLSAILLDVNFKQVLGARGKQFQLRLQRAGGQVFVEIKIDGKREPRNLARNGKLNLRALSGLTQAASDQSAPQLILRSRRHGGVVDVSIMPLGFNITFTHYRKFYLDIAATEASQRLKGNVLGILGNFNGNPKDDIRCPDFGAKNVKYSDCWHVPLDGKRLAPVIDTGSGFYKCIATKTVKT